jgi:hypothetical protein
MSIIDEELIPFQSVSLAELEDVRLLNRVDTKYIFRSEELDPILLRMRKGYSVLEVNGSRLNHYETVYYDTPDHRMYIHHHNGKLNRYKVRYRKYIDTDQSFFEIKIKDNKGRTVKKRMNTGGIHDGMTPEEEKFLARYTRLGTGSLLPSLEVRYTRLTFVNHAHTERITIDVDLHYKKGDRIQAYPDLVIAELKQERCAVSAFKPIMAELNIGEFGISKYCLGIIAMNKGIKQNNFKLKLHYLNKLQHDIK